MNGGSNAASFDESISQHAVPLIGLLALLASITSITNGFAFDDVRLIVTNDRIHSLANAWQFFGQTYWPPNEGATLYRPLTILAFSVQWAAGGGSPFPFHLMNVALYVIAVLALYRLLKLIVSPATATLASVFFAVHPVHTEAVANVVGQPEIIVAILIFISVERYITFRRAGRVGFRETVILSSLYLTACLFKEHAIMLPGLFVAAELVITREKESVTDRLSRTAFLFAILAAGAVAFVLLRTSVTGGFRVAGVNELLGGEPYGVRLLTMLGIVPDWVRLLLWPARLSADYSFPRTQIVTGVTPGVLFGIAVIVSGAVAAWHMRARNAAATFGFLWIAITMAIPSNLIIVTGFVLAERILFLASAGTVLLVALAVGELWRRAGEGQEMTRRAIAGVAGVLVILGAVRSATRNPAWHDNETLFRQTVLDVPTNSRAHWMLAETLAKSGKTREGADEIVRAVALGRKDDFILLSVAADQLYNAGQYHRAMPLYHRALAIVPHNQLIRSNAALCLMRLNRIEEAKALALAGPKAKRRLERLDQMIALADSISRLVR